MKLTIQPELKAEDFLQGVSWFGESDHDEEAVKKLKELNNLLTELIQKIYFLQLDTQRIYQNQHNYSAKEISKEAKELLINVVKMATDEEDWDIVDKLFDKEKVNE